MKIYLNIILFLTFIFNYSCRSTFITDAVKFDFIVLNDSIYLPQYDTIDCIDTISFKIKNNSDKNCIFSFNSEDVWLFPPKFDWYHSVTPVEGLNFRFRPMGLCNDLEAFTYSGNAPENLTEEKIYSADKLIRIKPDEELVLKSILKFPSRIHYNDVVQKVPSIRNAFIVDIVFEPDTEITKKIMKKNKIKLSRNDLLLKIRKEERLPVSIKCE